MIYNLKLKALNKKSLLIYSIFLSKIFKKLNIFYNQINLPKKTKKITLLTSPHVYKKAREQFETTTFIKFFQIFSNINKNLFKIIFLNKPQTIKIQILKKLVRK